MVADGGNGIAYRQQHREGQEQRRLAHGLGAMDSRLGVGVIEQRGAKRGRAVVGGGNFVGAGGVGEQPPGFRLPHQFFRREPAHALNERAFDLPDVDGRIERPPGIVQQIGAQQAPFAGEGIDQHFADRGAVGEVVERVAGQRLGIPMQVGRGVEAVAPQLHPGQIGLLHQGGKGQGGVARVHHATAEAHRLGAAAVLFGGERRQALAQGARGVECGHAIEVGPGRGGGGRSVGHLVGVGGGAAHGGEIQPQFLGDDLRHLGVQPLPHFGAAVVHQHAAIGIDVNECARLVQVHDIERDAELDRGERQPLLEHRAVGVEASNGGAARSVVGALHQLVHQRGDDVVGHALAVGRVVVPADAVEIGAADLQRVMPQFARDGVEHEFGDEGALRPAEAAEGGVALGVGLGDETVDGDIGQPVGVVHMTDGPGEHRAGEIGGMPGIGDQGHLVGEDATVVIEAHGVVVLETVAPAGDEEVVVAVEPQLHRLLQQVGSQRRAAGELRRLRFLAAEAAAHASAFHLHLMLHPPQHVGDDMLHLAGVLGGAQHAQPRVFGGHGIGHLAFEVELLLPAHAQAALQAMRGAGHRPFEFAGRRLARQVHGGQHILALGMGFAGGEHRRQGLGLDHLTCQGRRAAREGLRGGHNQEDRLTDEAQRAVGQNGIVVHHGAAVIRRRNVGGGEHGHHAGLGAQAGEVDAEQLAVRQGRKPQRRVQCAVQFGRVVGVRGLTADV